MDLKKLNLLFKLSLAAGIIIFALFLRSIWYNLGVILLMGLLLHYQRIRIFRFRSLSKLLGWYLILILIFRSFTGSGKILFNFPFGLKMTLGGITQGVLTVEQFLMIFLLVGISLYSSSKNEVFYYFSRLPAFGLKGESPGLRFGRMSMFVLYLLPEIFQQGGLVRRQLRQGKTGRWQIRRRSGQVFQAMGDFVVEVLRKAELLYPEFVDNNNLREARSIPVLNLRHALIFSTFLSLHVVLFWMWLV